MIDKNIRESLLAKYSASDELPPHSVFQLKPEELQ